MKKKSMNLGSSLTRNAIKKVNGGVVRDIKVGCFTDYRCESQLAWVVAGFHGCC